MSRIAIIGAGAVGAGIGRAWLAAGLDVRWGVRDPARYPDLPAERLASPAESIDDAAAIVLATPWPATEAAIAGLGDLTGRVVIDATNPLRMGEAGLELAIGFSTSGAEEVRRWAPGAQVVKALNQVGAEVLGGARAFAHRPAMFVAGDDAGAKALATTLVEDLGFAARDAGSLRAARLLEPLAMLWIDQALYRDGGRRWALVREEA